MKKPFLRTTYNYDHNQASQDSALRCDDLSLAQQHMLESTDINYIVKQFGISGKLPTGVRTPTYGDFTGVYDYHSAVNAIAQAGESFDSMPAHVRARFHNDPQEFLDFCAEEGNAAELKSLGLIDPALTPEPESAPAPAPEKTTEPSVAEVTTT